MSGLRRMVENFEAPAVPVQLRCGRSDKGTPWALVCDKSGQVLLHVTIAPGRYKLVAWNLSAPVRSPDLNTILRLAAENGQAVAESSDRIVWHDPGAAVSRPGPWKSAIASR